MTSFSKSPTVLNVDDNEPALYAKTRILRRAGFTVFEASDGTTALELVASKAPELVLLDVQLPDISGLDVCRRIKSDPITRRIPVLHISATHITEADQQVGMESGAEIYLVEPLAPEELITVVRTLLRLRRSEAGLAASEERLRLATESAGLATWDVDLRTGSAVFSSHLFRMLGLAGDHGPASLASWTDRIHPDDVTETLQSFEAAQRNNLPFRHECRIIRANDGAERWLAATGQFHVDESRERTRFIGIMLDITERRRADVERNELLQRESNARRAAEDAARLKDQFLATLSHELRTPMSAVLGWLHLLRSGKLKAEQEAQALETIERNARLQNQLINDLLDVSRIITGQLRIERDKASPAAILESAIDTVRPQASARRVAINVALPAESPVVWGDSSRLQQVFINLLVNAIKFSPGDGAIDVAMDCAGNDVEIRFIDHGDGIAPDMMPVIFERFRQADGSITRKHGGMGLGLAIARHIMDLHGGSVTAESAGLGQGATFTVRLPRLNEAAAMTRSDARQPAAPEASDGRLIGIHVLAVDDDANALGMLASMLELGGATVSKANSAAEAIEQFRRQSDIAVVLSDIGMPDRDGYDLIESLRRDFAERAERVAAVAITGYARDEDHARALHAGFDAHLAKPFGMDELFDAIVGLVRNRQSNAQASAPLRE
ncbi:MAG TPA: response regulator [Casimicrobiaceae bacterium]|nr:response regulator [Casimicrobiaceae bacterium]